MRWSEWKCWVTWSVASLSVSSLRLRCIPTPDAERANAFRRVQERAVRGPCRPSAASLLLSRSAARTRRVFPDSMFSNVIVTPGNSNHREQLQEVKEWKGFFKLLHSGFRLQLLLCGVFFFLMEKKYLSSLEGRKKKKWLCFNWSDSCYISTCFTFLFARMTHFNQTPLKALTLTFYREKYPPRVCCPPVVSDVFYHLNVTRCDVTVSAYCWTLLLTVVVSTWTTVVVLLTLFLFVSLIKFFHSLADRL